MTIFGGEKLSREEKQNIQKYLSQRGIDNLNEKSNVQIRRVINDLAGNGFFKAGMALSFAKAEEQVKVTYLSALVEQNWILISQNQEILDELKKINNN
ncbi:hypothetical protein ACEN7P_07430 [Streptococcus pyogenes]|uniref:hypothetical protein n=1 Tax=Streptococcus pyogenes TaxID=1314 RepID=UPI000DA40B71|nr:hypothetical protein [Streptococcus pyogenes]SQF13948.1 phage protein [Streptococcus pyogenes]VGQ31432.1 phage protein [Streptococcus pyogenes]VHC03053.1 phage protein [Streptococcus pyogenes]VHC92909.1 phage protein [Streptococcus pyogenes]